MPILDKDETIFRNSKQQISMWKIKNISSMKDFTTFYGDHITAFSKLYFELFQNEFFEPLSYTSIVRYFQSDFRENPNFIHAACLIGDFLKKERLVGHNSEIANLPSDALEDIVRYVYEISCQEDTHLIFELLQKDKRAYAEKIEALCKELMTRFEYIKSATVATAILSLITGWCPILHQKFLPKYKKAKNIADELVNSLMTLEPLISIGVAVLGETYGLPPMVIWACIHSMLNIYAKYYKF